MQVAVPLLQTVAPLPLPPVPPGVFGLKVELPVMPLGLEAPVQALLGGSLKVMLDISADTAEFM